QLTATLLLAESSAGSAQLDLYSDGGLQPGSFIGAFTSPQTYSSSTANTTFSASGLSLPANTNYWLVLKANSGAYDWSWSDDSSLSVAWGESDDAGSTWFTDDAFPLQLSVTASIPEPKNAAGVAAIILSS